MLVKVVLITGAFSGIGRSTTELLMQAKMKVVAVGRTEGNPIPSYAGNYLPIERDLRKPTDAEEVVEFALEKHGRIDVLINLAGSLLQKPLEQTRRTDFERMLADNFFTAVDLTQLVLPHMLRRGQGTVVFVPSVPANLQVPGLLAFKTAKQALQAYVHELQHELMDSPIQVHEVNLGGVNTDFWKRLDYPMDRSHFVTCQEAARQVFVAAAGNLSPSLPAASLSV